MPSLGLEPRCQILTRILNYMYPHAPLPANLNAAGETRTLTSKWTLAPQASLSTNSSTAASGDGVSQGEHSTTRPCQILARMARLDSARLASWTTHISIISGPVFINKKNPNWCGREDLNLQSRLGT